MINGDLALKLISVIVFPIPLSQIVHHGDQICMIVYYCWEVMLRADHVE